MPFRIHSLPYDPFAPLFAMTDAQLAERNARRMLVESHTGTTCRVSLSDAGRGETVLLVHYEHQVAATPYRASNAIFIRERAIQAHPLANDVPAVLSSRPISLRAFDDEHMMADASVEDGADLSVVLGQCFLDSATAYIDLHDPATGCFLARATQV